ncbi:MAG: DUF4915 domain-containing protein [Alphaproteobacteria bacterium]|nr:DUF4915 domain-containing protein [Alphaproteobacteria bacterium]
MDVGSDTIICTGLSMPHSPRWHAGRLWVLNSGTGELGRIDIAAGRFEPVCFCPGYLRGLSFIGEHFALVGLSKPREDRALSGLALDEALSRHAIAPRCGVYIVDLKTGDVAHSVTIEGIVGELYEVAVLPGVRQPSMVGLDSEEQKRTISIG